MGTSGIRSTSTSLVYTVPSSKSTIFIKLVNEFVPQEHRHFYAGMTTTEDDTDDET